MGGTSYARGPNGAEAAVSRSLGDRAWKAGDQGNLVPYGSPTLLRCVPEVSAVQLLYEEANPVLILTAAPVTENVPAQSLADIAAEFFLRPRAASGEIIHLAAEAIADSTKQCVAMTVFFLLPKGAGEELPGPKGQAGGIDSSGPTAKKLKVAVAKGEMKSVRLRHLLLRHRDCGQPHDPVRSRPVTRSQHEAEALLRRALRELLQEQHDSKLKVPSDPKKASVANLTPTPKCLALCRELSECPSASKGGGMCGDIGWVNTEELRSFGPVFADVARSLCIGQWSDLVPSQHGIHLVQRIA